jgi:transposase
MRTYKRRSTYRRHRRERVAELRAQGMSLREIAGQLDVSHETVRRDLALTAQVSHLPVTFVAPVRSETGPGATVTPIRRRA